MPIQKYLDEVQRQYKTQQAREHTYRPALANLLQEINPDIIAANDPARIHVGNLDFVIRRDEIDIGYLEAKDLNISLNKTEKSEQMQRYLDLDNLVLTDYLEFRFYKEGVKVDTVRIADAIMGKVVSYPENFEKLRLLLQDFLSYDGQTIKSSLKLAKMMARKARLMREVFYTILEMDEPSRLKEQMGAFQKILMHDLDNKQFADIYAQTITYGLFTARLHDPTVEDFSRQEAIDLIPKSNPFLRELFFYVTGPDLEEGAKWIIDALCRILLATNLKDIFEGYGTDTQQTDPVLHFYEDFLGEYDKSLRKARGVWYTPEPVVNFIVRAIDDVLKAHFNLPKGIADNSKIKIQVEDQYFDKRTKSGHAKKEIEVHKVQMLDVATGTGTFLAEAMKQIHARYKGQQGIWSSYVENDLLPRLHGFELLMASYAMCHMKLDLLLQSTGYKPSKPNNPPRVGVYLTNALEEYHRDTGTLLAFMSALSHESEEANFIKKNTPVMVAFGNPPYSGESSNKGDWIMSLMEDYKKEAGGKVKLQERNAKWLNDDYAKFIRMGEHYVEKNGEGVLAYITNHAYLDNPTFRGMRWHLMETFDDIYIIDLHGNSKKKETTPAGDIDQNVFDIQQGVAIIIAVKVSKKSKELAKIHHFDMWGKRQSKYDELESSNIQNIKWNTLKPVQPQYFLVPKDFKVLKEYEKGFSLNEMFPCNSVGIVTARDKFTIHETKESLLNTINDFSSLPVEEARTKYNLGKDARDWKVALAQKELRDTHLNPENIRKIAYRPFDQKWTYFTGKSKGFHCMPRGEVMKHMLYEDNIGLNVSKQQKSSDFQHAFIHSGIVESSLVSNRTSEISCTFPLYRYESLMNGVEQKVPNFAPKIYAKIKKAIPDVTPKSVFDYIYAVLHAPKYRERYAEFLKSDFPRIPYPTHVKTFNALVEQGEKLRALHLMESPALDIPITTYPVDGDHEVVKPRYEDGNVYINETQYFGNVPLVAWEFYIGGYQPAQKWLKDRKGRNLSVDDIMHYQRIIIALNQTARIMSEIDKIDFLPEGE